MDAIYNIINDVLNNQSMMKVFEILLPVLISTGIITALLSHWYNKKLRTHEIKLQKYINLIEELAKLIGKDPEWNKLRAYLNEALLFASDNVAGEILEFNKKFTEGQNKAEGGDFQMHAKDIEPLIIAIRKDLYLKSKSIKKKGLTFFQKP